MEAHTGTAREAARHVLDTAPALIGVPLADFQAAQESLASALANAVALGLPARLIQDAEAAARAAFQKGRDTERAALAAQHNASVGPDGPRLLPLCIELQLAIINKAYSDR